ncbi:MAG: periplasmic heavy metal sensor [Prosthecobacter sp.]
MRWLLGSVSISCLLAGLTAWRVADWTLHRHGESHANDPAETDLHAWMHEHLDITPEQHGKLDPIEKQFEEHRLALKTQISAAGVELAQVIGAANVDDLRMKAALDRLNQGQAQLQRLTLDHFFAMKRHLRPAQARKLVEWTHDSLTREH